MFSATQLTQPSSAYLVAQGLLSAKCLHVLNVPCACTVCMCIMLQKTRGQGVAQQMLCVLFHLPGVADLAVVD